MIGDRPGLTEAAAAMRACQRALAERGRVLWQEAVGRAPVEPWRHYPDGEVYDPRSHAQYFYHCHQQPGAGPDAEHGHFHLFLRAEGMPPGVAPLLLPELAVADIPAPPQAPPLKRGGRGEVSHLVAIAVDRAGAPIRLFTTNRWVTGETWYAARDVVAMLDCFQLPGDRLLDRWLMSVLRLFRGDIAALLCERDGRLTGWRRNCRGDAFEARRLEIASATAIDLETRLAEIDHHTQAPAPPPLWSVPNLPPMAEGWGA